MGGLYRGRSHTAKNKKQHRMLKTKGYKRATDQIHEDMKPENYPAAKHRAMDETLPGLGQYYCVPCARYFVDDQSIKHHEASKQHKKAHKRSQEIPYSHKEAEEAGK